MCRFINLNIDMSELEQWFKDYDRRIEHYENKIFILGDTYPVLPIVTREGILKAKWGLVPHWVKTKDEAMNIRKFTINARQETIFQLSAMPPHKIHLRAKAPRLSKSQVLGEVLHQGVV